MKNFMDNAMRITSILTAIYQEYSVNIYKNINTARMYAVVEFEKIELDSSSLHSSRKAYTPETRYDAQYSTINDLII